MLINDFSYYFEILTGIIALILCKKYLKPYYKFFLIYAIVTVLFESLGKLIRIYELPNGIQLFNIYTFFEYNLIAIIYYKLTKEVFSHKWIKYLMTLFNLIYLTSFVFITLQSYTVLLGAVIVSSFMILYLKELLNSDKIINFKRDLSFWITIAFLLYYLTTIPFYTVLYIIKIKTRAESDLLFLLQNIIIIVTHFCFINGLLWSTKQEN